MFACEQKQSKKTTNEHISCRKDCKSTFGDKVVSRTPAFKVTCLSHAMKLQPQLQLDFSAFSVWHFLTPLLRISSMLPLFLYLLSVSILRQIEKLKQFNSVKINS